MPDREKLIELSRQLRYCAVDDDCINCERWEFDCGGRKCLDDLLLKAAELLESVANGVTVQDDMTELIGRGLDNICCRIYGANKEFNDRMAGYNPSSFCAGFQYAIQLTQGLLTQLPQPPKV